MLISDRDGVLFDTCSANIESYKSASKALGLKCEKDELARAIHAGTGIFDFRQKVWGELSEIQFETLRKKKSITFFENLKYVRVNRNFVSDFLEKEIEPYLVTRSSLNSTILLLATFGIDSFDERVRSVPSGVSKISIVNSMFSSLNIPKSQLTIVDDSEEVIADALRSGFVAVQYPHFCNL
jgi:hypothetical protein